MLSRRGDLGFITDYLKSSSHINVVTAAKAHPRATLRTVFYQYVAVSHNNLGQ